MSNQNQNQLTPEQAFRILVELTELPIVKLNKAETRAVDAALSVIHGLVQAVKTEEPAKE